MATFLTTVPDEKIPVKVMGAYDGAVPDEICDYLANRIIGCAKDGFLYPASPMDVYGDLWREIERTARHLPPLQTAAATTYLHKAVDNALKKYFKRRIQPMRTEYRETEGHLDKADAASAAKATREAPEGKDVGYATYAAAAEGYDYAKKSAADVQPLTAQQLSTKLSGEAWARERRERAAAELEDLYAALCGALGDRAQPIVRAFRAYVAADGNMLVAAKIAGVGKTKFYQSWRRWLRAAKESAEKSAIVWH